MLNTLVHDKPVSMGSQWVVFDGRDVVVRIYKGGHMNTHDVYNVNLR